MQKRGQGSMTSVRSMYRLLLSNYFASRDKGDQARPGVTSLMEIFTVDAFSDKPFAGNPAAVCLVRRPTAARLDDDTMTKVASEMNLSETAFVSEMDQAEQAELEAGSEFLLRWFTPTCEVDLCGHATLATAAVLFHKLHNPHNELRFHSKSGVLKALRKGDEIVLDFPLNPCNPLPHTSHIEQLITAVTGSTPLEDIQYSPTTKKLLLRLPDHITRSDLENFHPDSQALLSAPQQGEFPIKGVILTVKGLEYDFLSRYFAPWVGIPEDPVTGAAHTVLASYWSGQLGKKQLLAQQCSVRGGDVGVEVGEGGRVRLSGKACIVMEGKLFI